MFAITFVLADGVPPSYIDAFNGWTALHWASYNASVEIIELLLDKGAILKRIRARAKGRAGKIQKQTSHITVTVGS